MNNIRENVVKYGSFILIFLAPLIYYGQRLYPHISSKTFFIFGAVELIFFVWFYLIIVDKSYRLPKKILVWLIPLFIFILWMTICGIFAVNPGLSFWSSLGRGTGLLTLYHAFAFSLVTASLVYKNGLPYIISFFQWFISSSFILALSVWLGTEGFKLPIKVLESDAGGGLAGNSTLTAGYLLFTFAIGAFLLSVKSISKNKKWMISVGMAITLFSPVFVNLYGFFIGKSILGLARGTILAILVGLGVVAIGYMFLSTKKFIKSSGVGLGVIGLIGFVFLWSQLVTPNTFLNQAFTEEARGTRFIFWDIATKAMNKSPILGYGPENYFMAYQENFNPQILLSENAFEGWVDRAHNIYYDLGVAGGYPAIIFYIVFILSIIYCVYRLYRNDKISRIQASILAGLVVAYITNHLFTFESNISILILFALVGMVYALNKDNSSQKFTAIHISDLNKSIIGLLLLSLFAISWIFLVYMPTVKSKAYAETFALGINKRAERYPELLKGSSVGSHWDISGLSFEIYKLYASNSAQLKNDKEKIPFVIKDLEALISHLYQVSENNKTDYRLYITISFLENTLTYMSGREYNDEIKNRVLGVLEKAKNLSPTNPNIYWSMAQVKVWGNDLKGVEDAYREAVIIAPKLPASYNLLLNYAKVTGNNKLFDEVMIQAKENIPGYELN